MCGALRGRHRGSTIDKGGGEKTRTRILVEVTHTEDRESVAAGVMGRGRGLEKTNKVGRNNSFARRHSLPHDTTHAFPWPSRALVRSANPSPAAHC